MNSDYIELRARSAFSFLEGATTPEDLAARAAELCYSAMALGDRDGLYGAPRFYAAAKSAGIRQIVGAELTLDDDSRLYVLAPDRKCYQNLCRMITDSKMRVLNPGALARDGSAAAPGLSRQGREPHHARRTRTLRPRTYLSWRRRDEPAIAHAGARRGSRRAEPAAQWDFRRGKFLHRFAASSRRR